MNSPKLFINALLTYLFNRDRVEFRYIGCQMVYLDGPFECLRSLRFVGFDFTNKTGGVRT